MKKKTNLVDDRMKTEEYIKLEPIVLSDESSRKGQNLHSKTIIYDNNFTNHHYGTTTSCRQKISTASIDSSFYSSSQGTEFKSKSCERLSTTNTRHQHHHHINEVDERVDDEEVVVRLAAELAAVNATHFVIPRNGAKHLAASNNSNQLDNNNFDCLSCTKKLTYSKSLKLVPQISNVIKPMWRPTPNQQMTSVLTEVPTAAAAYPANRVINDRTNLMANNKQPNVVGNIRKFNEVINEPSWKELAQRKHTAW